MSTYQVPVSEACFTVVTRWMDLANDINIFLASLDRNVEGSF